MCTLINFVMSPQEISEIPEISKFREIPENVGEFSPRKLREIFPRIFLHFQEMKHMLQR